MSQNDRGIRKLRVFEEAHKVHVSTWRKIGQKNILLCDASLSLPYIMLGIKEIRFQEKSSFPGFRAKYKCLV